MSASKIHIIYKSLCGLRMVSRRYETTAKLFGLKRFHSVKELKDNPRTRERDKEAHLAILPRY